MNFSFVQQTAGGSAASQAFGSNTAANDFIVVVAAGGAYGGQGASSDFHDSQSNQYYCIQQSPFGNDAIYVATGTTAAACTVSTSTGGNWIALEFSSARSPYYNCPGSGAATPGLIISAGNNGFRGITGPGFSSTEETLVVWGASGFIAGPWTATSGTVLFQGSVVAGYDIQSTMPTTYTNSIIGDGGASDGDDGNRLCIFINLTNPSCAGGTMGSGSPPGAGGVGQPDSSFGPTGSSAIPAANTGCLLVYFEQEDRWFYHRNSIGLDRFYGFLFDGIMMVGLTGSVPSGGSSTAGGFNVDDFRGYLTQDEPLSGSSGVAIETVFQSHFEDAGFPDNQKNWLEVVIDYVLNSSDTLTVQVGYNNFAPATVGTLTASSGLRKQVSFPLGTDGVLAKNISVLVYGTLSAAAEIHNVYVYYYVEARLALAASTIPIDLGSPQVKQCKELMLDADLTNPVDVNIYSDLPGNQLAANVVLTSISSTGRAIMKFPFAVTEGFLWRVALTAATSGTFRLYSARLLMRPVGVYVEAYESAAGFVWDSEPQAFESLITRLPRAYAIALTSLPIKRYREISLEIETFNANVTVSFLTDLPGNTEVVRATFTVNTALLGRRYVRLPLPLAIGAAAYNPATTYAAGAFVSYAGNSWESLVGSNTGNTPSVGSTFWQPLPIEGRTCRLQLSGSSKYVLYEASVEVLAVGIYVEAYEATAGAVYDSREMDFGSDKPKEARELELDIETTGAVTATLYCDLPGFTMTQCFQNTGISTTGRQKVMLPLTLDSAPFDYPIGRLFRLVITAANAFRLYDARLKLREFATYLVGDEASATPAGVWDSTPIDMGTERLKEFKKLELEIQTDSTGTATLKVWTDQPAGSLTLQFSTTISTGGARESVKIPLTYGIRGRLLQVEVSGAGVRLFNGRVWVRPMNEPKAQWAWAPLPIPPTEPAWSWASFLVSPTPPGTGATDPAQWQWAKILAVTETPAEWTWVDVPFDVTGP